MNLPNYYKSQDLMHGIIDSMESHVQLCADLCENLKGVILKRAGLKYPGHVGEFRLIAATAPELAEAFLRTVGRWDEWPHADHPSV